MVTLDGGEGSQEVCVIATNDNADRSCTTLGIEDVRWIIWLDSGTRFAVVSGDLAAAKGISAIQTVTADGVAEAVPVAGGALLAIAGDSDGILGLVPGQEAPMLAMVSLSDGSVTELEQVDEQLGLNFAAPNKTLSLPSGDTVVAGRANAETLVSVSSSGEAAVLTSSGPTTVPLAATDDVIWMLDSIRRGQGLRAIGDEPLLSFLTLETGVVAPIADRPGHRHVSLAVSPDDQHVVTIEIGTEANGARLSIATTESVVSGSPTWIDVDLSGDCCGSLDEGFEAVRWFEKARLPSHTATATLRSSGSRAEQQPRTAA